MSNILELIQKERDRIRAKRGVQDLEPERYLSILVEEVGEVAQAINDWCEEKGYIKNAMEEMVQVCAVAIDMYERLARLEDGDVWIMLDTWGRVWFERFWEELEKARGEDSYKWDYYSRPGRNGFEYTYTFIRTDGSMILDYTVNMRKIERDRISLSQKVNEAIERVRRELLGKNEDETK